MNKTAYIARVLIRFAPLGGLINPVTAFSSIPTAILFRAKVPAESQLVRFSSAKNSSAGSIEHAVGIEWVDIDVADHPAEFYSRNRFDRCWFAKSSHGEVETSMYSGVSCLDSLTIPRFCSMWRRVNAAENNGIRPP